MKYSSLKEHRFLKFKTQHKKRKNLEVYLLTKNIHKHIKAVQLEKLNYSFTYCKFQFPSPILTSFKQQRSKK